MIFNLYLNGYDSRLAWTEFVCTLKNSGKALFKKKPIKY